MNAQQHLDRILAENPEPLDVCHGRLAAVLLDMHGHVGAIVTSAGATRNPVIPPDPVPVVVERKPKAAVPDLRPRARQRLGELMAARQRIDAQVRALLGLEAVA